MSPIQSFDSEVNNFYRKIRDSKKQALVLGGNVGTGKSYLLRKFAGRIGEVEPGSFAVYFEIQVRTGYTAQLLELENHIVKSLGSILGSNGKKSHFLFG